ncbi:MAG TPA: DUF1045 domain-containing protein [Hypericibacter adhaerens]|uniref:DUF1045 domain-containing protein n=1 Tax=Hypericibacter adhaerens TaxID=2602016 RepID=UPI002CD8493C|nr:DUF1045 domain-containing protein [Hypericibacter adhaerens]HWA46337.1 DUF1045 domain-containing protein [Hypericibacter adhaerens]
MTTPTLVQSTTSRPSVARYAIYWAPPRDSELTRRGLAWLGRDAESPVGGGGLPPRPLIAGFSPEQLTALTAEPRRYALHATLKPPFVLAEGHDADSLRVDLDRFASSSAPFFIPPLRLEVIGRRFLALIPSAPSPDLDALAARCVTQFDSYRRPASEEELSRRRATGLDPIEEAHLRRWGYPYVHDRFRFHVTLTGPLDAATIERLRAPLAAFFSPATAAPVEIGEIALFVERTAGDGFTLATRFALTGRSSSSSL